MYNKKILKDHEEKDIKRIDYHTGKDDYIKTGATARERFINSAFFKDINHHGREELNKEMLITDKGKTIIKDLRDVHVDEVPFD